MAVKWIGTRFKGVRYYEHPTRKHGVSKDRYFAIRYQKDGKRMEEGVGWSSEEWIETYIDKQGREKTRIVRWTAERASLVLNALKNRTGEGPSRLAEKREMEEERRKAGLAERDLLAKEAITFKEVFEDKYFPVAKDNKERGSWRSEEGVYRNWIEPVIGRLPLKMVSPDNLELIKKNMADAGRAASSIRYALAVIRQVFNFAQTVGIYQGDNPVAKVKKPSADNRRLRFLTHAEADALLQSLAKRSLDVHDMALLSLHCGLRAGEIFSLTWGDVDMERGILTLRDTKSGRSRHGFVTDAVKAMIEKRPRGAQNDLVFPTSTGREKAQVSKTFNRVVDKLKLNEGVSDPRQKIVWHSLRHTCASWLVESGVDLFVVKEILGHSVIQMTERYAHLSPGTLQQATKILEKAIKATKKHPIGLQKTRGIGRPHEPG